MTGDQLTLLLNTVLAVFLPTLVGLVTTRATNASVQAILLLSLSVIQTLIGQIVVAVGTGSFDWFTWILAAIGSFVVGVATHYGFWKPTGVTDATLDTGRTAPAYTID
jgi:hypothetical protein